MWRLLKIHILWGMVRFHTGSITIIRSRNSCLEFRYALSLKSAKSGAGKSVAFPTG